jgi:hypothetical protein
MLTTLHKARFRCASVLFCNRRHPPSRATLRPASVAWMSEAASGIREATSGIRPAINFGRGQPWCSADPGFASLNPGYGSRHARPRAGHRRLEGESNKDVDGRFHGEELSGWLPRRRGRNTSPRKRLSDSHIVEPESGAVLDAPEVVEAPAHHQGTGFAVIAGPAAEPGNDPGRKGE